MISLFCNAVLTIVRLEDPFIGFNELKAEWVGEKSWTYRTKFKILPPRPGTKTVLTFDGLDTFAHVKLDGRTILKSDNMFLPHRVEISHAVGDVEEHDLEIEFEPALLKAREIKEQYPDHKWICFNGDSARLAVRKAQYHWGWDWGPFLMCAGIWRSIRLEQYSARISDIRTGLEINKDFSCAALKIDCDIENQEQHALTARVSVRLNGDLISTAAADVSSEGRATVAMKISKPELWMPNGYGKQTLYDIEVILLAEGYEIHKDSQRIGIRSVKLIQDPDSHGKSFYFRINGVDIFCGGSCWIPTDSFLTNVSREKYRAWIGLMVPANQKMIR